MMSEPPSTAGLIVRKATRQHRCTSSTTFSTHCSLGSLILILARLIKRMPYPGQTGNRTACVSVNTHILCLLV